MLSGNGYGSFAYFENTGSADTPAFTQHTDGNNPFLDEDVGTYSAPAFADLDGDGDLDMLGRCGIRNRLL